MQVVVVARGAPIVPFGVVADACPIGSVTLAEDRADTLRRCGLASPTTKRTDDDVIAGPALVLADDVWITRRALAAFLKQAALATGETKHPVRLQLPPSRLLELFLPLQDVESDEGGAIYAVAFVPAGQQRRAGDVLDSAAPLTLPYRELLATLPTPKTMLGHPTGSTSWPLTSSIVLRVRHWLHVLRAGHLVPQVQLLEHGVRHPLQSAWRALLGLRLTAAAREAAWKRRFVFIGKRCVIHPSAIVEGSVIGDDVTIGPGAIVLQSVIGAGTRIEQRAHISQSTIGRRNFISLNSSLQACVSFDDAEPSANNLQACVVGARAGLTSFARALDTVLHDDGRPAGPLTVRDGADFRHVGELPCGVCFGPDVYVGANVTVAAGRMIPAGVRLVTSTSSLLRRVPLDTAAGTYVVVDGGLQPFRS
ncbi:MAG TPA: hypothetical protein VGF99_10640 [Myxococcota bacterium]